MEFQRIISALSFCLAWTFTVHAAYIDSLTRNQFTNLTYNSPAYGPLRYAIRLPQNFQKTEKLPLLI